MAGVAEISLVLVERLYDAVSQVGAWPPFLDALAGAVGGIVPGVFLTEPATDSTLLSVNSDIEPEWARKYEAYYRRRDVRRERIERLPAGSVFVGSALVPDSELTRSEFYNDFLRPQGYFHIVGAVSLRSESALGVVRALRPRTAQPFGKYEIDLLRRLDPHVSRALRLYQQLARAEACRDETREVLDWFPGGVLLLDAGGRVVAANRMGEAILTTGDGLRGGGREGVRATVTSETIALQRLIASIGSEIAVADPATGALNITRSSRDRPLHVFVAPLRGRLLEGLAPSATMVMFVTDPERLQSTPVERVQRWLGLTRAEASLVLELMRGRHVESAADALGISVNTARTQLKRALMKTGAGRQAELVRLVLATPAGLVR